MEITLLLQQLVSSLFKGGEKSLKRFGYDKWKIEIEQQSTAQKIDSFFFFQKQLWALGKNFRGLRNVKVNKVWTKTITAKRAIDPSI